MQQQVASMNPRMSPEEVRTALRNVIEGPQCLKRNVEVMQEGYESKYGPTKQYGADQFYEPQLVKPVDLSFKTTQEKTESTDEESEFEKMRLQEGR